MIILPRTEWQTAAQPVTGPAFEPGLVRGLVWHWPGGYIDVDGPNDVLEPADTVAVLRAMQNDYLTHRGYSLGYSWCIDQMGACWEIRGTTYRPASNGSVATNQSHVSCLLLIGKPEDGPSDAMVRSARELVAVLRERWPGLPARTVHADLFQTTCCGPVLTPLARAGVFEPQPEEAEVADSYLFQLGPDVGLRGPGGSRRVNAWEIAEGGPLAALLPARVVDFGSVEWDWMAHELAAYDRAVRPAEAPAKP